MSFNEDSPCNRNFSSILKKTWSVDYESPTDPSRFRFMIQSGQLNPVAHLHSPRTTQPITMASLFLVTSGEELPLLFGMISGVVRCAEWMQDTIERIPGPRLGGSAGGASLGSFCFCNMVRITWARGCALTLYLIISLPSSSATTSCVTQVNHVASVGRWSHPYQALNRHWPHEEKHLLPTPDPARPQATD